MLPILGTHPLGTALPPDQVSRVLTLLRERSISYVTFQESDGHPEWYHMVLELEDNGLWTCSPVEDGRVVKKDYEVAV